MVVRAGRRDESSDGKQVSSQLNELVGLMRAESMAEELGSSAILNALSAALFALMLRTASEAATPPAGLLALASQPRLAPALNAMFNNPRHNWGLEELADLCNMSRATIVRQFNEKIGRSANELLTDIRMTIAGNALRDKSNSTDAVAEDVGYQSIAAFRRAFTRHTGKTPGEWRRSFSELDAEQT
ncbi:Transcriptional regulator, AraC family [Paraburkholderia caribensis MBA4]|uniref:Transcriptional regulator, AraC family n=2 Tax=Paraburkholderia caribensis TaxID=75105 RepID=A0A0N7JV57_9BURK|nr:Transcriptional regulator, AraC family [Paraburkholderia caribensis MBA4]